MVEVNIPAGNVLLAGDLNIPRAAKGLVIFAHGSGSSRFSLRNRFVANFLEKEGFATLLMDLLTGEEEETDTTTGQFRFDVALLADRVAAAIKWSASKDNLRMLPLGLFGASTGAAAALIAAARLPVVRAVVSRGGRPDLAIDYLPRVKAPTFLVVGGEDDIVIGMNQEAFSQLKCVKRLEIVPGASHLFEEKGKIEIVADLACQWFTKYFT